MIKQQLRFFISGQCAVILVVGLIGAKSSNDRASEFGQKRVTLEGACHDPRKSLRRRQVAGARSEIFFEVDEVTGN
jgi:hypothetical protein